MLQILKSTISECAQGISSSLHYSLLSKARKSPKKLNLEKALSIYRNTKEIENE